MQGTVPWGQFPWSSIALCISTNALPLRMAHTYISLYWIFYRMGGCALIVAQPLLKSQLLPMMKSFFAYQTAPNWVQSQAKFMPYQMRWKTASLPRGHLVPCPTLMSTIGTAAQSSGTSTVLVAIGNSKSSCMVFDRRIRYTPYATAVIKLNIVQTANVVRRILTLR